MRPAATTATFRRLVAPLLLALWALQPVVMVQHVGAHFHRFCVEHGVFEDVAAGATATAAPSEAGQKSLRTLRPESAVAAETPHEECGVLASRTPQLAAGGPALVLAVTPPSGGVRLAHARDGVAPVPLLHRAPKASPPARA